MVAAAAAHHHVAHVLGCHAAHLMRMVVAHSVHVLVVMRWRKGAAHSVRLLVMHHHVLLLLLGHRWWATQVLVRMALVWVVWLLLLCEVVRVCGMVHVMHGRQRMLLLHWMHLMGRSAHNRRLRLLLGW